MKKTFAVSALFLMAVTALFIKAPSPSEIISTEVARVEDACAKGDKTACNYLVAAARAEGK